MKTATPQRKSFCVLQFAKSQSVITMQREFRRKFKNDPPSDKTFVGGIDRSKRKDASVKEKALVDQEGLGQLQYTKLLLLWRHRFHSQRCLVAEIKTIF
jgi:hypothetical protein